MIEEWKDLEGYEGIYQISNMGVVRSVDRVVYARRKYTLKGKVLKQASNGNYNFVCLEVNGTKKNLYIHRAVAEHFVPNPENLSQVNHKDENKLNNRADNLEWCTPKYNANYGSRNQKISKSLRTERSTE